MEKFNRVHKQQDEQISDLVSLFSMLLGHRITYTPLAWTLDQVP